MTRTFEAVFDGEVLRPDKKLPIEANTRLRVTVETVALNAGEAGSFLETARALRLEGPPDWAERIEDYLQPGPTPNGA